MRDNAIVNNKLAYSISRRYSANLQQYVFNIGSVRLPQAPVKINYSKEGLTEAYAEVTKVTTHTPTHTHTHTHTHNNAPRTLYRRLLALTTCVTPAAWVLSNTWTQVSNPHTLWKAVIPDCTLHNNRRVRHCHRL